MIFIGFFLIVLGIVGACGGMHEAHELIAVLLCIVVGVVIRNYYWR